MKFLMQQTEETDTGSTTSVVRINGSTEEIVAFLDQMPALADMLIQSCVQQIVEFGESHADEG